MQEIKFRLRCSKTKESQIDELNIKVKELELKLSAEEHRWNECNSLLNNAKKFNKEQDEKIVKCYKEIIKQKG